MPHALLLTSVFLGIGTAIQKNGCYIRNGRCVYWQDIPYTNSSCSTAYGCPSFQNCCFNDSPKAPKSCGPDGKFFCLNDSECRKAVSSFEKYNECPENLICCEKELI